MANSLGVNHHFKTSLGSFFISLSAFFVMITGTSVAKQINNAASTLMQTNPTQTPQVSLGVGPIKRENDKDGTFLLAVFRDDKGLKYKDKVAVDLTISGPNNWGPDRAYKGNYQSAVYDFLPNRSFVAGTYKLSGTIDGKNINSSVTIASNIESKLDIPSEVTITSSKTDMQITWAPNKAKLHVAFLYDENEEFVAADDSQGGDHISIYPDEDFNSDKSHELDLYFLSIDNLFNIEPKKLPQKIDVSLFTSRPFPIGEVMVENQDQKRFEQSGPPKIAVSMGTISTEEKQNVGTLAVVAFRQADNKSYDADNININLRLRNPAVWDDGEFSWHSQINDYFFFTDAEVALVPSEYNLYGAINGHIVNQPILVKDLPIVNLKISTVTPTISKDGKQIDVTWQATGAKAYYVKLVQQYEDGYKSTLNWLDTNEAKAIFKLDEPLADDGKYMIQIYAFDYDFFKNSNPAEFPTNISAFFAQSPIPVLAKP